MKQLSYHHILEKSKGGKATVENGALLSTENHQWFHKQTIEKQRELNTIFQEYKKTFSIAVAEVTTEEIKQVEIIEPDIEEVITIPAYDITEEDIKIYEEHKKKRNERVYKKFEKPTQKTEQSER